MKITTVLLFLLTFFIYSELSAQEKKFDRTKYAIPAGWKEEIMDDVVSYTGLNEQTGAWCQLAVYKSVESKGNVEADFASEWEQLIVKSNKMKSGPVKREVNEDNGWKVLAASGTATFHNAHMDIIHIVISGYNVCVSIVIRSNSLDAYMTDVDKFVESVNVMKPDVSQYAEEIKYADTGLVGTWVKSSSARATWADPASVGLAGYTKDEYIFDPGGRYNFISKTFRSGYDKIILVKESGTYTVAGDKLSLAPQASVIESWSKKDGVDKWGKRLSSQNRMLENTTYTFKSHYFEGIKQSNLVLQADKPTERDGAFSGNTTYNNAYYYAPASENNTAIDLPQEGAH